MRTGGLHADPGAGAGFLLSGTIASQPHPMTGISPLTSTGAAVTAMLRRVFRTPSFWITVLALLLAFGFLGTRGIWDPDEGRYTNVALNMLDSGDWLNPRRTDEVGHWTKPPLTYWAIAGSVAVFGQNAWSARLPSALAYLLCVWLAWRIARRLVPGSERIAAVAYATMLFTVGAAQMITTDYVLSACTGVAMWAFVESRFGDSPYPRRWTALMWAAFALAFLAKGPPALIHLLAALVFDQLMPERRRSRVLQWSGLVIFVVLALPWYAAVIADHPGLFRHFVGDEVVNRVATNEFGRNGEWYGWLQVYAPTLLLGTLPWTSALLRWARALPAQMAVGTWSRMRLINEDV
jgi:4-amino-4-deoxy-L-arabinose transferase-like glycosyltransferase